jgi:DNA-directed RNA polymerase specialized sigma24 family protein
VIVLGTRSPRTIASVNSGLATASELDLELFDVLYGRRAHELITFFYRRTRNPDAAAELLAETFAVGVLRRRSDPDLSVNEPEWLRNIAKLQLSRYFRKLEVELVAVNRLGMEIPRLTDTEIVVLEAEIYEERNIRLGG